MGVLYAAWKLRRYHRVVEGTCMRAHTYIRACTYAKSFEHTHTQPSLPGIHPVFVAGRCTSRTRQNTGFGWGIINTEGSWYPQLLWLFVTRVYLRSSSEIFVVGVFGEARSLARTHGLWWVHGRTRLQKELISGGHKTASVHASALPLLRRGPQEEFARRRRALRPPRAIASAAAPAAAAAAHIKASTTFSRPRCRLLDKCVSSNEGCVLGRGGWDWFSDEKRRRQLGRYRKIGFSAAHWILTAGAVRTKTSVHVWDYRLVQPKS